MGRPDKRRQIMQVAEQLFTSRGFHEITTDDIAAAACVGKGTIYRYFKDKDDLFFQTATNGFDELCELVRSQTDGRLSFDEQLLAVCRQIREFFESRRPLFRMIHSEESRLLMARGNIYEKWLGHRRRLTGAVAAVLERGVAEGQIRSDVPAEVLATFLLGMLRTQARDMDEGQGSVREVDLVADLFCRGAKPNPLPVAARGRARAVRRMA
jgi:AcrR family transcriptional regulator